MYSWRHPWKILAELIASDLEEKLLKANAENDTIGHWQVLPTLLSCQMFLSSYFLFSNSYPARCLSSGHERDPWMAEKSHSRNGRGSRTSECLQGSGALLDVWKVRGSYFKKTQ